MPRHLEYEISLGMLVIPLTPSPETAALAHVGDGTRLLHVLPHPLLKAPVPRSSSVPPSATSMLNPKAPPFARPNVAVARTQHSRVNSAGVSVMVTN